MDDEAIRFIINQTWSNVEFLYRFGVLNPVSYESISRRLPPRVSAFNKMWNPFPGAGGPQGGMGHGPGGMGGMGPGGMGPGGMAGMGGMGGGMGPGGFMNSGPGLRRSRTAGPGGNPHRREFAHGPSTPGNFGGPNPPSRGGPSPFGPGPGPFAGNGHSPHPGQPGSGADGSGDGQPLLPDGSYPKYVQAMFPCDATFEGAIAIQVGDIIQVLDPSRPDWWQGVIRGRPDGMGLFPANHTRPYLPNEDTSNLAGSFDAMGMGGPRSRPGRSATSPMPPNFNGGGPGNSFDPMDASGMDPSMGPGGGGPGGMGGPHPMSPRPPYSSGFEGGPGGGHSPRPSNFRHSFDPRNQQRPMSSHPDMMGGGGFQHRPRPSGGPGSDGGFYGGGGGSGMGGFGYGPGGPDVMGPNGGPPGGFGPDGYGFPGGAPRPGGPHMRRNSFQPDMMGRRPSRRATPGGM
ncbi:Growth factor receptor-bound protein 2 [Tieghemiomyces parasiticus]|uniref:Growth factor receptor-bound protein 2 n=1 Tax=Tieghemiomyces parasiticus TaxID=78921 RepID=A0A9W8DUS9_9FUNG|nr:Growth factor receptor-bound protein 2 [Tieghemiomyces parasiticus]